MCIHTYLEKYYDLAGASRGKQRGRTEDSIWDVGGLRAASCGGWSAKLTTVAFRLHSLMQATLTHTHGVDHLWWCQVHAGQIWGLPGFNLKPLSSRKHTFVSLFATHHFLFSCQIAHFPVTNCTPNLVVVWWCEPECHAKHIVLCFS